MDRRFYEYIFHLRASGFEHHTQESVYQLMSADAPATLADMFSRLDGEVGSLSENYFRDLRNFLIGCCFMTVQFFVDIGIDMEYACGFSDYYINRMDSVSDIKQLTALFAEMVEQGTKLQESACKVSYGQTIDTCIHYIDQKLYSPISASDAAAYMELHPSYLSSLFKEKVGVPLHRFILDKKMAEAEKMLRHTKIPVNQLAEALGFSSPAHFSAAFKKYAGVSPAMFRDRGKEPK